MSSLSRPTPTPFRRPTAATATPLPERERNEDGYYCSACGDTGFRRVPHDAKVQPTSCFCECRSWNPARKRAIQTMRAVANTPDTKPETPSLRVV